MLEIEQLDEGADEDESEESAGSATDDETTASESDESETRADQPAADRGDDVLPEFEELIDE